MAQIATVTIAVPAEITPTSRPTVSASIVEETQREAAARSARRPLWSRPDDIIATSYYEVPEKTAARVHKAGPLSEVSALMTVLHGRWLGGHVEGRPVHSGVRFPRLLMKTLPVTLTPDKLVPHFLNFGCEKRSTARVTETRLFEAFLKWCEARGVEPVDRTRFVELVQHHTGLPYSDGYPYAVRSLTY